MGFSRGDAMPLARDLPAKADNDNDEPPSDPSPGVGARLRRLEQAYDGPIPPPLVRLHRFSEAELAWQAALIGAAWHKGVLLGAGGRGRRDGRGYLHGIRLHRRNGTFRPYMLDDLRRELAAWRHHRREARALKAVVTTERAPPPPLFAEAAE
jgi:hypothetical protein